MKVSNILWALGGAVTLLVLMMLVFHFQPESVSVQLNARARRREVTDQMRVALASAAEAEKSAVLAITDEDSRTFADQARAATARVEQLRVELATLLPSDDEKELLGQFSKAFTQLQKIDKELLELAVLNTNLKASALAFGPAAAAIKEMDAALSRLIKSGSRPVMLAAATSQAGALRLANLLPPHIAEQSDVKMDELEKQMKLEDAQIRQALKELPASPDADTARSQYALFTDVRSKILKLSRENTNVRSLSISLNEKRKVTALCQDVLMGLQKAIADEPTGGLSPAKPR